MLNPTTKTVDLYTIVLMILENNVAGLLCQEGAYDVLLYIV